MDCLHYIFYQPHFTFAGFSLLLSHYQICKHESAILIAVLDQEEMVLFHWLNLLFIAVTQLWICPSLWQCFSLGEDIWSVEQHIRELFFSLLDLLRIQQKINVKHLQFILLIFLKNRSLEPAVTATNYCTALSFCSLKTLVIFLKVKP